MPIIHNNKILYIHVPKTAGSSIKKFLEKKEGIQSLTCDNLFGISNDLNHTLQHSSYSEIVNIMQNKNIHNINFNNFHDLSEYKIFTIVRNPYDRMVSEYFYRLKGQNRRYYIYQYNKANDFEFFVKNFLHHPTGHTQLKITDVTSFNEYDNHRLPQSKILEGCTNVHIMKFENLNNEFQSYFHEKLTYKENISNKWIKYTAIYNANSQKMVHDYYKEDFEKFGYRQNLL